MSSISERILSEWKEDRIIDKTNLINESLKQFTLQVKYLEYLNEVTSKILDLESKMNVLRRDKFLHYENNSFFSKSDLLEKGWETNPYKGLVKPSNKTDKDIFFNADVQIGNLNDSIKELKNAKEILDHIFKFLHNPFLITSLLKLSSDNGGSL